MLFRNLKQAHVEVFFMFKYITLYALYTLYFLNADQCKYCHRAKLVKGQC